MKKISKILALAAFTMVGAAGCVSTAEWERYPEKVTPVYATDATGTNTYVKSTTVTSGGYRVKVKSPSIVKESLKDLQLTVDGQKVSFGVADYSRDWSANYNVFTHNLITDFATLAEKIAAAYATCGATVVAEGAKTALEKAIANYIAKGGNAKNATITFANGNGTITDGIVTEVCTNCAP